MGNAFCFNGFNRFTWFHMDGLTKNDGCLINEYEYYTEKMTIVR